MKDMVIKQSEFVPIKGTKTQRDNDLKKACKDFESVFTYQVLRSMRRTINKCDLFHGGQGEEIYESLLDQEMAKNMAGTGRNSLANMLYQQLRRQDTSGIDQNIDDEPGLADKKLPIWPVKATLSSRFGWRKDPFTGDDRFHYGIDLAAKEGTQVRAPLAGKVLSSKYKQGYGNTVLLDHGNGFTTLYAHNKENLVSPGDWVKIGSPIAEVGSTGRSTGPHLHFEVRKDDKAMDPLNFLKY